MRQPRTLVIGVGVALVVMVTAWFILVYRPKGAEIADVEEQVETASAEEQSLRATLLQLQSIDEERPEGEAEVRRLTAAIPPDPELAGFILAVHDLASRADLGFVSISPALPTAQPGSAASVIATAIEVEGNFANVVDFLDRLEELERITVVDSLTLTASEPEEAGEPEAPATASATAQPSAGLSTPVQITLGDGTRTLSVTTDAATAGRVPPTTITTAAAGSADALLVRRQPVTRVPSRIIRVSLQARLFTTAAPSGGGEAGATTTTAPAGGGEATTTTTTAAGGGG